MSSKKEHITLLKSFACAGKGVISAFKYERNVRIHCCALFYVLRFSFYYDFTAGEKALLALAVGMVIASELMNTAVENTVDLVTEEQNRLAGLAKDIAAGAVLVSALAALAVGVFLFGDLKIIRHIVHVYKSSLMKTLLLAATVVIWLIIIFLPEWLNNRKVKK